VLAAGPGWARERPVPPPCSGSALRVDGDFEQAGFAACTVTDSGTAVLTIAPETRPINPSPWYAARLTQAQMQARRIELDYRHGRHRYAPWLSVNGGPWQRLTAEPLDDGRRAAIALPPFAGTALLAAQPIKPLAEVRAQWAAWAAVGQVVLMAEAASRDGRVVPLYRHGPAGAARLHIFAARQHPPETTGAAAFDAFAQALLAARPADRCPGHAFLFAPILNPDGIVRGHWRTTAGRIDLNRDWGAHREPESSGIAAVLTAAGAKAAFVSVLDFHSTHRDVLYSPGAAGPAAAGFAQAAARHGLVREPTRSVDAATLKSWGETRLGAAAFTVEFADSHSPDSAAAIGAALAGDFLTHLACPAAGE
jgi:hypothetical protein